MAFPTIQIDSATGSDTAASGAGPSTALTGTSAATDGAGTTVTLDAGTVLTGVLTTGAHALYLRDATTGHRNFAKITATAGSGGATPTVTVAEAFTASLTGKTWAIGGKRASLGATDQSYRLTNNNGASGDAMPGWILELASGHTETVTQGASLRFELYRPGDRTNGPITIRAASGYSTMPVLTFTSINQAFLTMTTGWIVRDVDVRNTNASNNTAAFYVNGTGGVVFINCKVSHSANKWKWAFYSPNVQQMQCWGCEAAYCTSDGFVIDNGLYNGQFFGCYAHHNTGHGFSVATGCDGVLYAGCISAVNGGDGFNVSGGEDTTGNLRSFTMRNCTSYGNTGDGAEFPALGFAFSVFNNIFAGNGGYGVKFSNGSASASYLRGWLLQMRNNAFYNNTSGKYTPSALDTELVSVGEVVLTGDPFTNAASGDFTLNNTAGAGAACRSAAFPATVP